VSNISPINLNQVYTTHPLVGVIDLCYNAGINVSASQNLE